MAETTEKIEWGMLLDEALTTEGSVSDVYNRFYEYSFLNCMLLRMQGVHEPVATYKRWQALGRQVIRGARARSILRPVIIKGRAVKIEEVAEDSEQPENSRLVGFKMVKCLFPLSETIGKNLPPTPPLPKWDIKAAETKLGITEVPFDELNGNIMGYSVGLQYAINPLNPSPRHTRFHEFGHIVLGHTLPSQHADYQQHRGIKEFEAESTAFLCMHELGQLDEDTASHSRGYIQNWLKGERPSDESIRAVFRATDAILRSGRLAVESFWLVAVRTNAVFNDVL